MQGISRVAVSHGNRPHSLGQESRLIKTAFSEWSVKGCFMPPQPTS